jgi:hypothetical protein
MSYGKQNFEDGNVLKAEHLNHIEDGIASAILYLHTVTISCSNSSNAPYATVEIEFLSRDSAPITTLEEARLAKNVISKTASLNLEDSFYGEREVTFTSIGNYRVRLSYVTAYTVPKTTSQIDFNSDVCDIYDYVKEV